MLIKHIYFISVKLIKNRVLIQLQSDYVINLIRYFQMLNILHLGDKNWQCGPVDMELD